MGVFGWVLLLLQHQHKRDTFYEHHSFCAAAVIVEPPASESAWVCVCECVCVCSSALVFATPFARGPSASNTETQFVFPLFNTAAETPQKKNTRARMRVRV